MITEADEQNPLNFGSNVGHKVSIFIFLEITTLYTKFLFLFTDATEPTNSIITDGDEQNPLNLGNNVGHKVSIIIFLEITKLYTKFLLLFTDATEPRQVKSTVPYSF